MKHKSFIFFFLLLTTFQLVAQDQPNFYPEISGWKIGEVKVWDHTNLYVPINGAADLFFSYNFEQMFQTEYSQGESYFTVEAYQHKTPEDAFGVYSQEKPDRDIYVEIGVQGYKEADYFFFVAGRYYIKIRTNKAEESSIQAMNLLAEKLADELNQQAAMPKLFSVFPLDNKVPFSEMYLNENILGFSFLKHSYEVSYENQGSRYTLFILVGDDADDATEMLKSYLEYIKQPVDNLEDNFYSVDDIYSGQIYLVKKGRYLLCSRGSISEEGSKNLLKSIAEELVIH